MPVQMAFKGVRADRQHRKREIGGQEQPQLFAFGPFIAPPRKQASAGGRIELEIVDLRTDYERMRETHAGEIK